MDWLKEGEVRLRKEEEAVKMADDSDDEDDDIDSNAIDTATMSADGRCVLVWEGTIPKPHFERFSFEVCRSEQMARGLLQRSGLESYWDMCRNWKKPE